MNWLMSDVDGCLTAGRWAQMDVQAVAALRQWPCLILASGRSQPYMECLAQVLGSMQPMVCETGAAIFDPQASVYTWTDPAAHAVAAQREALLQALTALSDWRFWPEPGKEFSLSLAVTDAQGHTVPPAVAYPAVCDCLQARFDMVEPTYSNSAIDVVGRGVQKGKALGVLAEQLGVPTAQWAGFGDGVNDLSFLQQVGYSGAPSNAAAAVRAHVHFVADAPDVRGLLAFMQHLNHRHDRSYSAHSMPADL